MCLAAFLIQVIVVGHLHVFGIYYISFLEDFKDSKGKTCMSKLLLHSAMDIFITPAYAAGFQASSKIRENRGKIERALQGMICRNGL